MGLAGPGHPRRAPPRRPTSPTTLHPPGRDAFPTSPGREEATPHTRSLAASCLCLPLPPQSSGNPHARTLTTNATETLGPLPLTMTVYCAPSHTPLPLHTALTVAISALACTLHCHTAHCTLQATYKPRPIPPCLLSFHTMQPRPGWDGRLAGTADRGGCRRATTLPGRTHCHSSYPYLTSVILPVAWYSSSKTGQFGTQHL